MLTTGSGLRWMLMSTWVLKTLLCFRLSFSVNKGASGSLCDWLLARPATPLSRELLRELRRDRWTTRALRLLAVDDYDDARVPVIVPSFPVNGHQRHRASGGSGEAASTEFGETRRELRNSAEIGQKRRGSEAGWSRWCLLADARLFVQTLNVTHNGNTSV